MRNLKDEAVAIEALANKFSGRGAYSLANQIARVGFVFPDNKALAQRATGNGSRPVLSILSVIRRHRAKVKSAVAA